MSISDIAILKLFNAKAEDLEHVGSRSYINQHNFGFSWSVSAGKAATLQVRAPSLEATGVLVSGLWLFVQEGEPISFQSMGTLYKSSTLPQELRNQYANALGSLQAFLDSPSMVSLRGETLTNRRVLDVFLYGGWAHASPVKESEFEAWAADEMLFGMLQTIFHSVVAELIRFILWVHDHNLRAIAALEAGPAQGDLKA